MKYVFFGTPRFAAIVLEKLVAAKLPPAMVVCNPDRPVGRKKIITAPPTKIIAIKEGSEIDIAQPDKLDEIFIKRLKAIDADFFVVAAYAKIIPQVILSIPRLGTIGVHPSLLPKYRGASPIQSVILNDEKGTGTTLYSMDEKMDHGAILAQQQLTLTPETSLSNIPYADLEQKLAILSAELFIKNIQTFLDGKIKNQVQDESEASYTKKFATQDGFIEENDLAAAEQGNKEKASIILGKINAFNPEPGCWTLRNGKRLKLLQAGLHNGALKLIKVQEEGGKEKTVSPA